MKRKKSERYINLLFLVLYWYYLETVVADNSSRSRWNYEYPPVAKIWKTYYNPPTGDTDSQPEGTGNIRRPRCFRGNEYSTHRIWTRWRTSKAIRSRISAVVDRDRASMQRKSQRWRGRIRKSIMQDRRYNGMYPLYRFRMWQRTEICAPKLLSRPDVAMESESMYTRTLANCPEIHKVRMLFEK